ncbi:hypothetical protein [Nocardioides sp. LHG3406-4]|uniref:hypothetical protein n=1 Tax=Nocardioides sp. LHG3406-4 TaxID=2804575 RepID=UPI003CF1F705
MAAASVTAVAVAGLLTGAPPASADPLPPTAVAMGDSFISGEGAGDTSRLPMRTE